MQMRTPYALIVAVLLLATGAATAEDRTNSAPQADAAYAPGFELAIGPHEAWTKPGAAFTFTLKAYARGDEVLTLAVRAPDALRVELEPDVVKVAAGQGARATLTVGAATPSREGYPIVVTATDEDGNERTVRAILRVASPDDAPAPKPPAYEPRPHEPKYDGSASERRIAAIVARLERIERYLGMDRDPATPAVPPTAPGVRATLATPDAVIGPEGGRVALLVQAGEKEVRLPIGVRFDEGAGWKVELEKDGLSLRPHERTWLWVHLVPGEDAAPLKYAIVLKDPAGAVLAEGSATARMP